MDKAMIEAHVNEQCLVNWLQMIREFPQIGELPEDMQAKLRGAFTAGWMKGFLAGLEDACEEV